MCEGGPAGVQQSSRGRKELNSRAQKSKHSGRKRRRWKPEAWVRSRMCALFFAPVLFLSFFSLIFFSHSACVHCFLLRFRFFFSLFFLSFFFLFCCLFCSCLFCTKCALFISSLKESWERRTHAFFGFSCKTRGCYVLQYMVGG